MSQKLTPELASKVIRADLKNIIDKVGAGKPLNGAERNLFDGLRLTTEDLGKKRQLSLLGKWANGKRLNATEMSEIAALLPLESLPDPDPEPQSAEEEKKKRGRNGYYHTYQQHADWYGSSLRTIKRWAGLHKKNSKIPKCPLDDPEKLYSWLNKYISRTVPDGVLKALIEWRKENGISAPEPESESESGDSSSSEEDDARRRSELDKPVSDEECGLEAALRRLEEMEVRLSRIATEPGGAKPWLDTISRMTSVSTKLREEMEKLGRLIPKEIAEGVLIELMQPVEQGVRALYDDMCNISGLVPCQKSRAEWDKACDALFLRFGEEVFGAVAA